MEVEAKQTNGYCRHKDNSKKELPFLNAYCKTKYPTILDKNKVDCEEVQDDHQDCIRRS